MHKKNLPPEVRWRLPGDSASGAAASEGPLCGDSLSGDRCCFTLEGNSAGGLRFLLTASAGKDHSDRLNTSWRTPGMTEAVQEIIDSSRSSCLSTSSNSSLTEGSERALNLMIHSTPTFKQ